MSSKRSSIGVHLMSTRHRLELQELFEALDKDKDGKVSPTDLEAMLNTAGVAAGTTTVPSMLKNIHTDSNGNLDFDEFARLMRPTLHNPLRLTKKQQELKEAFDAFDQDGDGTINATELMAMMQQLGDRVTLQEAEQMIKEADHDKDGVIDLDEFTRMMGVRPPSEPISSPTSPVSSPDTATTCPVHHRQHHRYSVRKFFCKCHNNSS
ncbi:EF-hand [Lichtheimia hyalospora FSU 10163]|nr:EF-hand [Lichtheimia hyalospora FSU 10163]